MCAYSGENHPGVLAENLLQVIGQNQPSILDRNPSTNYYYPRTSRGISRITGYIRQLGLDYGRRFFG